MKTKHFSILLFFLIFGCNADNGDEINVEVVVSNEKLQCQDNAIPISQTQARLTDSGISVIKANCGLQKGIDFPAVCGAETGQVHIFTIYQKDLNKAENIGFIDSSTFDEGFELVDCDTL